MDGAGAGIAGREVEGLEEESRDAAHTMLGELYCLSCGRYLGDVERDHVGGLRVVGPRRPTRTTASVVWRAARPYCSRCGGRAVVERSLGSLPGNRHVEAEKGSGRRTGFHRRSA